MSDMKDYCTKDCGPGNLCSRDAGHDGPCGPYEDDGAVAPVAAKDNSRGCGWYQPTHKICDPFAEPKSTPSELKMIEIVRITPQECFDKAISLIHKLRPTDGCDGQEDYADLEFYVHGMKPQPDSSSISTGKLICKHCHKPIFADTSYTHDDGDMVCDDGNTCAAPSSSTEQTFEEWWDIWERDTEGFTEYEITLCESSARAAWNAAKGQSNGR